MEMLRCDTMLLTAHRGWQGMEQATTGDLNPTRNERMTMKRHPTLRQLSSDHHSGLVLARKARSAANGSIEEQQAAWSSVVARFEAELEPHFRLEEKGLLMALERAGETQLVERTLREHAEMRALIAQDRPGNLTRFAERLTAHIRFEERELFERAQLMFDATVLSGLPGG